MFIQGHMVKVSSPQTNQFLLGPWPNISPNLTEIWQVMCWISYQKSYLQMRANIILLVTIEETVTSELVLKKSGNWFHLCVFGNLKNLCWTVFMKLSVLWLWLSSTYLCCAQTTNAPITGVGGVNGLIINQSLQAPCLEGMEWKQRGMKKELFTGQVEPLPAVKLGHFCHWLDLELLCYSNGSKFNPECSLLLVPNHIVTMLIEFALFASINLTIHFTKLEQRNAHGCLILFNPKALNASTLSKHFDPQLILSICLSLVVQDTALSTRWYASANYLQFNRLPGP